jgi:hypothetical protein
MDSKYILLYKSNFGNGLISEISRVYRFGLNQMYFGKNISSDNAELGIALVFDFDTTLHIEFCGDFSRCNLVVRLT